MRALFIVLLLILFALLWRDHCSAPPGGFALPEGPDRKRPQGAPIYASHIVSQGQTRFVHSPAAVEIGGGRLRAFWYGGSGEGAGDTALYSAVFDPLAGRWSRGTPSVSKRGTQEGLHRYIKTLGNPVVLRVGPATLWLFYVSVSVGGWSGSAINLTTSTDEGETWGPPRRLIASPFFNLSTLVKGPPFLFEDRTIGLPVYHEFIGKFGELLRLDREGRVIYKQRLTWGRFSLQPVIVPMTPQRALCLMRYHGEGPRRIVALRTKDGGRRWSEPEKTTLPNPNAAIAALRLDSGDLLLVFNNSEDRRDDLSLGYSDDGGQTWRVIHAFEKSIGAAAAGGHRFSYPCLIRGRNGGFHLLYSVDTSCIKHVRFNLSWVVAKR